MNIKVSVGITILALVILSGCPPPLRSVTICDITIGGVEEVIYDYCSKFKKQIDQVKENGMLIIDQGSAQIMYKGWSGPIDPVLQQARIDLDRRIAERTGGRVVSRVTSYIEANLPGIVTKEDYKNGIQNYRKTLVDVLARASKTHIQDLFAVRRKDNQVIVVGFLDLSQFQQQALDLAKKEMYEERNRRVRELVEEQLGDMFAQIEKEGLAE